jgi:hypothetical protein
MLLAQADEVGLGMPAEALQAQISEGRRHPAQRVRSTDL